MSLTSALFAGVSGLNSQSAVLSVIGDNIANVSTVGFKAGNTSFASLVTGAGNNTNGSGVSASTRLAIDQQGLIQSTGIATDIAISGNGFFVVNDNADPTLGSFLYTRAGSFRQDSQGNFVNASGYYLQAYRLSDEGELPDENTVLESLETVNTRDINGLAVATSSISLGLNLDANEDILTGAGDNLQPVSTLNNGVGLDDVLAPTTGQIELGDAITTTLGDGTVYTFTYGGVAYSDNITTANAGAGFLGSTTTTTKFPVPGTAGNLDNGDGFTITLDGVTSTFTVNFTTADADAGTFNSLETLADAIDSVPGLSARVTGNQLFVGPDDGTLAMTFANLGTNNHTDLVAAFGTAFDTTTTASDRFCTLGGLKNLVNDNTGISATSASDTSDTILTITVDDPLQTIEFTETGGGNLITEFGFPAQTAAGASPISPIYDAAAGRSMASGDISADFTRNIRVFDGQGIGHDLRISFVKSGNNEWLAELYSANPDEITVTNDQGLITSGTIEFNGDGTLKNISASLSSAIDILWTNGTGTSSITLDLGTSGIIGTGLADGLSQFAGNYNVQFAEQNGSGSGLLSSIEISDEGFVIANFTNGQSRNVFQIALASFQNPNGLSPKAGNAFTSSDASGAFTLAVPGGSGVGTISTSALEQANTDLATELTKMIIAQRAFQSNTKIITTADQLLEELNQIAR